MVTVIPFCWAFEEIPSGTARQKRLNGESGSELGLSGVLFEANKPTGSNAVNNDVNQGARGRAAGGRYVCVLRLRGRLSHSWTGAGCRSGAQP